MQEVGAGGGMRRQDKLKRQLPLHGVHVCITGLSTERKQDIRSKVVKLGGRYSGELNTSRTTHLLAEHPEGPKYDAVVRLLRKSDQQNTTPTNTLNINRKRPYKNVIYVVKPAWIDACVQAHARVSEAPYDLLRPPVRNKHTGDKRSFGGGQQKDRYDHQQQPCGKSAQHVNLDKSEYQHVNKDTRTDSTSENHALQTDSAFSLRKRSRIHCETNDNQSSPSFSQPLIPSATQILQSTAPCFVFHGCSFFLLLTPPDQQDTQQSKTMSHANKDGHELRTKDQPESKGESDIGRTSNTDLIARLIRHGMGMLHDELQESLTHIVVSDKVFSCPEARRAISYLCSHHPNGLHVVSPRWIAACLHHKKRLMPWSDPDRFLPQVILMEEPVHNHQRPMQVDKMAPTKKRRSSSSEVVLPSNSVLLDAVKAENDKEEMVGQILERKREGNQTVQNQPIPGGAMTHSVTEKHVGNQSSSEKQASSEKKTRTKATNVKRVLEDMMFYILPLPQHGEGFATFDTNQLSKKIVSSGGTIVTLENVQQVLKTCRKREQLMSIHVVSVGKEKLDETSAILKQKLQVIIHADTEKARDHVELDLQHVTPVWVLTCLSEVSNVPPSVSFSVSLPSASLLPLLFQPQSFRPRTLSSHHQVIVAVTGFVGVQRTAVIHMLRFLGGTYTETLRKTNTHLISCVPPQGPKYDRAVEWGGIHVVSLDWLYHVMQYGYGGNNGAVRMGGEEISGGGCEDNFSLVPKEKRRRELLNKAAQVQAKAVTRSQSNINQKSDDKTAHYDKSADGQKARNQVTILGKSTTVTRSQDLQSMAPPPSRVSKPLINRSALPSDAKNGEGGQNRAAGTISGQQQNGKERNQMHASGQEKKSDEHLKRQQEEDHQQRLKTSLLSIGVPLASRTTNNGTTRSNVISSLPRGHRRNSSAGSREKLGRRRASSSIRSGHVLPVRNAERYANENANTIESAEDEPNGDGKTRRQSSSEKATMQPSQKPWTAADSQALGHEHIGTGDAARCLIGALGRSDQNSEGGSFQEESQVVWFAERAP